jgi:pimeloyl-ACP methyl ester carboxylesterase
MRKTTMFLLFLVLGAFATIVIYVQMNKEPDRTVAELSARWATPPSTFINIKGMSVHLRDEGPRNDIQPIVLIHGTSASLHTWDGWTSALSTNRRVIRFDLPGFGLTGPDPSNTYTIEHYASVVVAVLDALNIESAVIGGNSLGGNIAWVTAVLNPERVAALVLVDPSGYAFESESIPIAFRLSQSKLATLLLKDFIPRFIVEGSVKNVYGNPDLVTEALVDRYYELSLREGNRDALNQRFLQSAPGLFTEELVNIKVPSLIIWGGLDRLIPPALAKRFEQDISNSQLIIFDALGHVPHEEDAAATVVVVQAFLETLSKV